MKTETPAWTAVTDALDLAALYTAEQLAGMAKLLQIQADQRSAFELAIGQAGAVYLKLRHQETAPRPAEVRHGLKALAGQLGATRKALLGLEYITRQALGEAFQEFRPGHAVTADGDLSRQVEQVQRGLRNLQVLAIRAARRHADRRGRPSKGAVRGLVRQLAEVFERFTGRQAAQRGHFLSLVEQAAHPLDSHLRNTGLDAIVREIVSSPKKPGTD